MSNEIEIYEAELAKMQTEREAAFREMEPLQKKVIDLWNEMKSLAEARDTLKVAEMKKNGPDFPMMLKAVGADDISSSMVLYRYFDNEIAKLGGYHGGIWSDTREAAVKIQLTKGSKESIRKTVELVKKFVPMMKPHLFDIDFSGRPTGEALEEDEGGGRVWFGIFERSLSAGGIFRFEAAPDLSKFVVGCTSYSRYRKLAEFTDLEAAITYVADHHPYDSVDDDELESEYHEGRND